MMPIDPEPEPVPAEPTPATAPQVAPEAATRMLIGGMVDAYLRKDDKQMRAFLAGMTLDELTQVHTMCHHLGNQALYAMTRRMPIGPSRS